MGRIKCSLCFKKKQAKKTIFAPKIALRVECSDPARNPYFPADFLSARLQCSQLLWNCAKIKAVYRRAQGERRLEIARTIGLNCSMTHSPGKIEYNCHYFIMTFRRCRIPIRHFFSQSRRLLTTNFESVETVNEKCRCL